jgi:tRNA threonylcarbamoyladenosine biosynthesis protein TsaE
MKEICIVFCLSKQLLSLDDTRHLAEVLSSILKPEDILTLQGDLGAGKTTFARYLIRTLCQKDIDVPSPTFTLVQTYETPAFTIWHFDLYRMKVPDEAFELGIEEAFAQGISLIEWPQNLGPYYPHHALTLSFEDEGSAKKVTIRGNTQWETRLCHLKI